jgi:RNA polymerase sigma-70 factor (ECF subfamily)
MEKEKEIQMAMASDREVGFKMLMDAFQQPLYYFIRRMVVSHDDTEDVLQETFIKIYRHYNKFREESSLSTWIYKIATNECLRFLGNKKEETLSTEDIQAEQLSHLMASEYVDYDNELAIKFQQAIIRLPKKQRMVFNLRYYEEMEYGEISRILRVKVETVKVNYHYAKEKIKEYIINQS